MVAAINEIGQNGCSFMVGGRSVDGVFRAADAALVPDSLTEMFSFLSEEEFRLDISSTELRAAGHTLV